MKIKEAIRRVKVHPIGKVIQPTRSRPCCDVPPRPASDQSPISMGSVREAVLLVPDPSRLAAPAPWAFPCRPFMSKSGFKKSAQFECHKYGCSKA
jgi:hypothetical protein